MTSSSRECVCCETRLTEASHGGYYCSNDDCLMNGLINPCMHASLSKMIDDYRFKNNLKR